MLQVGNLSFIENNAATGGGIYILAQLMESISSIAADCIYYIVQQSTLSEILPHMVEPYMSIKYTAHSSSMITIPCIFKTIVPLVGTL